MTQAGAAECDDYKPKAIVLFSDGTGNSSSKLQKTNVWRLYEALDLGDPAKAGDRVQVAYYDDGVGNSSFRVLAVLGGVFGWGLARNVRELYKFLCRTYRDGDEIYAFGYSRGSYTIRLLVAMIAQFGIIRFAMPRDPAEQDKPYTVRAHSEAELDEYVSDIWREFRLGFRTNNLVSDFIVQCIRWIRSETIAASRRLRGHKVFHPQLVGLNKRANWFSAWASHWWDRYFLKASAAQEYSRETWTSAQKVGRQPIKFVGVFDTVAAYGGPVAEITRAIDDWFWPISMPDYRLSPMVETARHALAIDDKRGSFEPLLWDEVFERSNPEFDRMPRRLEQVWFAGMHSDVGGGYSDESLSYIPLLWMLEEARAKGLNFIEQSRTRIREYANPHGFMHNSRRGLGAFYRYQPRYVRAWMDTRSEEALKQLRLPREEQTRRSKKTQTVKKSTGVFRNQVIDKGRYALQGFLVAPLQLHVDAVRRMQQASDGYAPINLIDEFSIAQTRHGGSCSHGIGPFSRPDPSQPGVHPDAPAYFKAGMRDVGTHIRLRRFWYFLTMLILISLLFLPFWGNEALRGFGVIGPSETIYPALDPGLLRQFGSFGIPEYFHQHARAIFNLPALAIGMLAVAGSATLAGMGQEARMRDLARTNWQVGFAPVRPSLPHRSPLPALSRPMFALAERFKRNPEWQWTLSFTKWSAAPFILGAAGWWAIFHFALPRLWDYVLPAVLGFLTIWPAT